MGLAVEASKRLFLVNSASAIVTRILRVSVLAWLYQHLLKRISTEEFAVYVLVITVMVFAQLFSTLFISGISRFVVDACAKEDETRVRQIVSSIAPLLSSWALVVLGLGGVFTWNLDRVLTVPPEFVGEAQLMLSLLLLSFAANLVFSPFTVGFQARQKFLLLNIIQLLTEAARILMLLSLMYGVSTRVLWVVVATVSTSLVGQLVCVVVSRRLLPALRFDRRLSELKIARELLSFGFWMAVGQLASLLYISADIIILNKLGTSLDQTNFKIGSDFYLQIQAVVSTTMVVFIPALTTLHARGDWEQLGNAYLRGSRYTLWLTMLVACPLIVYARELIGVYLGQTYIGVASVMVLLLVLLALAQTIALLPPLATATAKLRAFSLTNLFSQLLKLGLTLYVVGVLGFGAAGCAMSTLLVIGLAIMIGFWPLGLKLARVSFARFSREVLWLGLLPSALAIGGGLIIRSLLDLPTSWLALAGHATVCCLIYLVVLIVFGLTPEDRQLVMSPLRKRRR